MLLAHRFSDSQLNLTLELFLRIIKDLFEERLVSVVLYGSIVSDDLAPGYGDLDFLAVVSDNLSEDICRELAGVRKPLRSGDYGVLATMIEGVFLPRRMLNPANMGTAFWWGTGGERFWKSNQLGWFVLHVIHGCGMVIWGEDIRQEIPVASHKALAKEAWRMCESMREYARGGSLHSVDWLLAAARTLLWLREHKLSSKSEAADWGFIHADGAWRELLPQAKQIRLNPSMVDSPEVKRWLGGLTHSIREACEEVEQELIRQVSSGCD